MFRFFKRLLSVLVVFYLISMVLNLKVAGTPTREWTQKIWASPSVQKVYTTVRDRILALVRKDISVEEVFKPDLSQKASTSGAQAQPSPAKEAAAQVKAPKEEVRKIDVEKLDEKDREALERILDKAAQ